MSFPLLEAEDLKKKSFFICVSLEKIATRSTLKFCNKWELLKPVITQKNTRAPLTLVGTGGWYKRKGQMTNDENAQLQMLTGGQETSNHIAMGINIMREA